MNFTIKGKTIKGKEKTVSVEGLLVDFINRKEAGYIEPTRKGTPKGHEIGMPQQKFMATLLALTTIRVIDQAKFLKVSHDVLRTWRTQRKFWDQVVEHFKEFSPIFWKQIEEHYRHDIERWEEFQKLPLADFATTEFKQEPFDGFSDRSFYGIELIDFLAEGADRERGFKQLSDEEFIIFVNGRRMLDDFAGMKRETGPRVLKQFSKMFDEIKFILAKEDCSVQERKHALILLDVLKSRLIEREV